MSIIDVVFKFNDEYDFYDPFWSSYNSSIYDLGFYEYVDDLIVLDDGTIQLNRYHKGYPKTKNEIQDEIECLEKKLKLIEEKEIKIYFTSGRFEKLCKKNPEAYFVEVDHIQDELEYLKKTIKEIRNAIENGKRLIKDMDTVEEMKKQHQREREEENQRQLSLSKTRIEKKKLLEKLNNLDDIEKMYIEKIHSIREERERLLKMLN